MTLLDDFKQFVKDAEGGTQYAKWAKDNPGELSRWQAFRDAILAGQRPSAPTMLTPHGRELIDAGIQYLDATIPVPVPPPPTPTGDYETAIAGTLAYAKPSVNPNLKAVDQNDLLNKIANMQPGDHIFCTGLTLKGELVINKVLAAYGAISFDETCKFIGTTPGSALPCLWLRNLGNIFIYFNGAELYNADRSGIKLSQGKNFGLYDFYVHDNGGDGIDLFPGYGDIDNFEIRGLEENCGHSYKDDPHTEKGTGFHGMNASDSAYNFKNGKIQLDVKNQPIGAAIELGAPKSSLVIANIDIWQRVNKLGFALPPSGNYTWAGYSKTIVSGSGNALQLWGPGAMQNVVVKYLEVNDIMGQAIFADSLTASTRDITVEYLRLHNGLLAPNIPAGYKPWNETKGIKYLDAKVV